ncbi:MAG: TRZ/ATZ family hydrolase [Gammaproteobacteria bacterium]
MEQVDLIISADWIIPVEPRGAVYTNHAIAIKAGHIVALAPSSEIGARFSAKTSISRPGHALIPGLVNAHTHAAMSLFRGIADDLPLEKWLGEHIWPAEARWASAEFVRDGTELAICEMLRGGTTCFQDMYFFPDVVAQAAVERNIRAVVGMIVLEVPTAWAQNAAEYIDKGLAVHDRFRGSSLVHSTFAPHAPYTVTNETFERIRMLADELDTHIHMHVHETASEVDDALREHRQRPLQRLDERGLVTSQLAAVHMTQLQDVEIELLAERGASVIHCPESNLKLASGFCPVDRLMKAGVNVALGTDGAASNNDLDLFGEMRTAALLAKGVANDASAVTAEQALEMATLGGARAIGLADEIGSLKPGKSADIVALDFGVPACQPVHHPISQVVYSASREQVADVWVAGNAVVNGGELLAADQGEIIERASAWQKRLAETDAQHD